MTLRVRVVGVGDAFTARYHNACLLAETEHTRLLIDAPPALARALADLGDRGGSRVSLDDIDHVLITHLHGDHVGGLEQLLYWRRFVTGRKAHLYAIPEVLSAIWETRLQGGMATLMDQEGVFHAMTLSDYAEITELSRDTTAIGDLRVAWRNTRHHIPTAALRITCGGTTFGYSADTAFDPSLIDWLNAADMFFHETNLGVHTPLASLVGLPEEKRRKMQLIHYPDFHEVGTSPIPCAREGDSVTL